MEFQKINQWLTLLSNLGVIAGIFFLGFEISQNTTAIRAEIYQARAYESANAQDFRAESEHVARIFASISNGQGFDFDAIEGLDDIDKVRLWHTVEGTIRRFDNNLYQCEIGFLDERFCREFEAQVRELFPYWQASARAVGDTINPAFYRILELVD